MEGEIKNLENAIIQLENENQIFKTRTVLLQKEAKNLQDDTKLLYLVSFHFPMTARWVLFNKKTKNMEE